MKILYKEGHKPIKHSAVSSDGGFLETTVTGVTNLSHGSIVYGDAGEIVTELPAGAQNEVLTMGVNTPAWSAGASGAWTLLEERLGSSSLSFGSVGGTDLQNYQWCRVIGSCGSAVSGNYFNLNFTNATTTISSNYYSQGIFGSRVVAIAYTTENGINWMPFGFTGSVNSTVGFDFMFAVHGNGLANHNIIANQISNMNGGNGNSVEMNNSVCAFTSASDISGFLPVAGASGGALSPTAGSVNMSVFAS